MTDRHAGFIVTLQNDMRDDDAKATINAILQIKNVISVEPIASDPMLQIAQRRAEQVIGGKVFAVVYGGNQ